MFEQELNIESIYRLRSSKVGIIKKTLFQRDYYILLIFYLYLNKQRPLTKDVAVEHALRGDARCRHVPEPVQIWRLRRSRHGQLNRDRATHGPFHQSTPATVELIPSHGVAEQVHERLVLPRDASGLVQPRHADKV